MAVGSKPLFTSWKKKKSWAATPARSALAGSAARLHCSWLAQHAIQDPHIGCEYTAPPAPRCAGGGGAPGIMSIGTIGPLGPRSDRAPSLRRDRFDTASTGRCPSDRVLRAGALRLDRVSAAGAGASVVGSTICVAEAEPIADVSAFFARATWLLR